MKDKKSDNTFWNMVLYYDANSPYPIYHEIKMVKSIKISKRLTNNKSGV